jgi:2-dehydro-3-deoxyphosphogluconate aldolase/(4S)-4-hydroxy-2-oxoglutarate aldolase
MAGMFPDDLMKRVGEAGVIAVLTIDDPVDAVPLARALMAGGVLAIELTLRTPRAVESIRRIRAELPDVLIGAGTVLNRGQLEEVRQAGALFAVSPGCNPATLRAAKDLGLPFAPGVATPSDIEIAVENGCRLLKFFPAETSGGLAHLTTMGAPFAHLGLRYIPLGGISVKQLGDYLKSSLVASVGGSWLAKPDVIARRDWTTVEAAAVDAMRIVREVRPFASRG